MTTSTMDLTRYIVDGEGINRKVIDTLDGKEVYNGTPAICQQMVQTLNAGFIADYELNRSMLRATLRPLIKRHEPETWSIRPNGDFGATIVANRQTLVECVTGDEAMELCRLARELYEELSH